MSQQLVAGQIFDGYRIIRFLGRGGFGEVWLCQSEAVGDYRAFKWIPANSGDHLQKEYDALILYRKTVSKIRSPHLVPIEHINRDLDGLYYIMPLADGEPIGVAPLDPDWHPVSLLSLIQARYAAAAWFSPEEIHAMILPLLSALQTLSDAGLVHRDVKPENILFFGGHPCLGDISLLGADTAHITRRGTPGYSTPSWYQGGLPDMYGAAATLYTLLTGNLPDKMGRSAFLWPPPGENSLSEADRAEWRRLHAVIRRAADEKVSERFVEMRAMAAAVQPDSSPGQIGPKPSSKKIAVALAACIAAIGLIVTSWLIARQGGADKKSTTVSPTDTVKSPTPTGPVDEKIDLKPEEKNPGKPNLTPEQEADYTALATMVQGYVGSREYTLALATIEQLWSTYPYSRTQPAYSIARAISLHGLGRVEEAKEEMRKEVNLSPYIGTMSGVKDTWERLGDLAGAEETLTRTIEKYGPNTFPLFLRSQIRAKLNNFPGVQQDRETAYTLHPHEPDQRRLVDTMWAPLETKYPGYGSYRKSAGYPATDKEPTEVKPTEVKPAEVKPAEVKPAEVKPAEVKPTEIKPPEVKSTDVTKSTPAPKSDDTWVQEVMDGILSDLTGKNDLLSSKKNYQEQILAGKEIATNFEDGEYGRCLTLMNRSAATMEHLVNTPVFSLFRALLLERSGRSKESKKELQRACHSDIDRRLVTERIALMDALSMRKEAVELLTRMLDTIDPKDEESARKSFRLFKLRARMHAAMGQYKSVEEDRSSMLSRLNKPSAEEARSNMSIISMVYNRYHQDIEGAWEDIRQRYPGYAAYLKTAQGK